MDLCMFLIRGGKNMALINCPECGKSVSDKATVCIHCGYPINVINKDTNCEKIKEQSEKNKKTIVIIFIIFIILSIGTGILGYNYSISGKKEANQAIEILKDYKSGVISSESARSSLHLIANTLEDKADKMDKYKAVNLHKINQIIYEECAELIYDRKISIDTAIAKLERLN